MLRRGDPPYLECSSKGERRLSAFSARIRAYGNKSIEDIYQAAKVFADGSKGLSWREAKGRTPVNIKEVRTLYSQLWDIYIDENPDLQDLLMAATGVSDIFGKEGNACQAEELWRIREQLLRNDRK